MGLQSVQRQYQLFSDHWFVFYVAYFWLKINAFVNFFHLRIKEELLLDPIPLFLGLFRYFGLYIYNRGTRKNLGQTIILNILPAPGPIYCPLPCSFSIKPSFNNSSKAFLNRLFLVVLNCTQNSFFPKGK